MTSLARGQLADAHRIVVKLGTAVVTHQSASAGVELALGRVMALVEDMARLRAAGREVVLVSSGAVGMGMRVLGLRERPRSLGLRQACAAIGQGHMIGIYTRAFAELGVTAAQVLLTQEDLGDRDRALCLRTTLMRLLELRAVPILNENDSVSVRELVEFQNRQDEQIGAARAGATPTPTEAEAADIRRFGDNDGLSALVAVALDADLLVMLTDVAGVYDRDPRQHPDTRRLSELAGLSPVGTGGVSPGGTGGMASKLAAAQLASAEGTAVLIACGDEPRVLERALAGDDVGTLITTPERRAARRRHIAVIGQKRGALVVNEGALRALVERKASLLPIGVVTVDGRFEKGDVVEIRDGSGRVHGRGLVNYDADACRALAGRHSDEIDAILGWRGYDAVVTRDNLVLGAV